VSSRETAIAALHSGWSPSLAVRTPCRRAPRRDIPQRIPRGGLVVVRDGEAVEETPILSPLAWQIEHRAVKSSSP